MKSGKAPAIMGGDAQKEAAGMDELQLGDLVQMRKTHPCGSDKWTVIRVGRGHQNPLLGLRAHCDDGSRGFHQAHEKGD